MSIATTTHLNFRGTARAALEHYRSVFGGDLAVVTYEQAGALTDGAEPEQIMWGQVASPDGFRVMAYDVPAERPWEPGVAPFFVSVRGATFEEVEAYWTRLAEGATVLVPFAASAWSPGYGMLVDPFGVSWVLDVAVAQEG